MAEYEASLDLDKLSPTVSNDSNFDLNSYIDPAGDPLTQKEFDNLLNPETSSAGPLIQSQQEKDTSAGPLDQSGDNSSDEFLDLNASDELFSESDIDNNDSSIKSSHKPVPSSIERSNPSGRSIITLPSRGTLVPNAEANKPPTSQSCSSKPSGGIIKLPSRGTLVPNAEANKPPNSQSCSSKPSGGIIKLPSRGTLVPNAEANKPSTSKSCPSEPFGRIPKLSQGALVPDAEANNADPESRKVIILKSAYGVREAQTANYRARRLTKREKRKQKAQTRHTQPAAAARPPTPVPAAFPPQSVKNLADYASVVKRFEAKDAKIEELREKIRRLEAENNTLKTQLDVANMRLKEHLGVDGSIFIRPPTDAELARVTVTHTPSPAHEIVAVELDIPPEVHPLEGQVPPAIDIDLDINPPEVPPQEVQLPQRIDLELAELPAKVPLPEAQLPQRIDQQLAQLQAKVPLPEAQLPQRIDQQLENPPEVPPPEAQLPPASSPPPMMQEERPPSPKRARMSKRYIERAEKKEANRAKKEQRKIEKSKPVKCQVCDAQLKNANSLATHMSKLHNSKGSTILCIACNKQISRGNFSTKCSRSEGPHTAE
jgi:hypothetical protein